MIPAHILPAEGNRYAAALLFVPELWVGVPAWRGFASYLAHRGWECHLLDVRGRGGLAGRVAAVVEYACELSTGVVLVGHGAGALVAAAAAPGARARAAILVAPLVPGSATVRRLLGDWRTLATMVLGRPMTPPVGQAVRGLWDELGAGQRARAIEGGGAEDAAVLRDLFGRRRTILTAPACPTLVVVGEQDPLLPGAEAAALATALRAEREVLPGAGHWPMLATDWPRAVGLVHRWLVTRLGEALLDRYAEAMAERDSED